MLSKIYTFICDVRRFEYVIGFVALTILFAIPIGFIRHSVNDKSGFSSDSVFVVFFFGIIIGPLLETFLFFYLPDKLGRKFNVSEGNKLISITVLFGFWHAYSILYIFDAMITGVLWFYAYKFSIKRRENAFVNVMLIHSIYNSTIMLFSYFA